MSQAFTGAGYIQQIALAEVNEFVERYRAQETLPVDLAFRNRFNPNLTTSWFGGIMEIINQVTMLSIILTGAALIREREHGTLEHLLVMPVTPTEIMLSKIWSMGLVVLVATGLSLFLVVHGALGVPRQGSPWLFLAGAALHLFATTSMGIFLATLARSMPQFGMLLILVLLPMQMLSGGSTPKRKHARTGPVHHAPRPDNALRPDRPGRFVSWRRHRRSLDLLPRLDSHRRRPLLDIPFQIQKVRKRLIAS
ncbi:MAG: ABC transporter permease [Planctomycetaceae bacterium]|nr:ABC transporter permease [Planctomycetaceae bacterium]